MLLERCEHGEKEMFPAICGYKYFPKLESEWNYSFLIGSAVILRSGCTL